MTDLPFPSYAFKASPASTGMVARTMPDRLAEVVNVKDFLPTSQPDGSTDNTSGIQAAFDAAFKNSSGVSHGFANSSQNRPVYFPGGHYRCNDLQLETIYGGRIFGAGSWTVRLDYNGASTNGAVIRINGFVNSSIENMNVGGGGQSTTSNVIGIDLDWDGTTGASELTAMGATGWLNNCLLLNIGSGANCVGIRVAESEYDGAAISLVHYVCANAGYGIKLNSDLGTVTTVGGGIAYCNYGAWINKGSYSAAGSMNAGGYQSSNPTYAGQTDILHNSTGVSTFVGTRTESQNQIYATAGKVNLIGVDAGLAPNAPSLNYTVNGAPSGATPAEVSIVSCILGDPNTAGGGLITGNVTLSLRNILFAREIYDGIASMFSGFTGQVVSWIHPMPFTFASLPGQPGNGLMLTITDAHTSSGAWGQTVSGSGGTTVGNALVRWNAASSHWTLVGK